MPLFANSYWTDVANFFGIYMLLGLSLNIIVGYAGMFNLGHAAFYAVGAYTTAIINTRFGIPLLVLMPIAALTAAGFAALITRPVLHLRGDYLCIVTIGFGEIVRIALINNPFGLTGGPNGVLGIDRPALFGFTFYQPGHFFYLIWVIVILVMFGMRRLENSRLGRAWNYVREDELAAEAMGIDATNMKLLAFILGAGLAGIAGTLYAGTMTVIAPESFGFWESVSVRNCGVGGPGSTRGSGRYIWDVRFAENIPGFSSARMLVFGAAHDVMMIFRPGFKPSQRVLRMRQAKDWNHRVSRRASGFKNCKGLVPMPLLQVKTSQRPSVPDGGCRT